VRLAELQDKGSGSNPYVLYYQKNAGHSGSMVYEERHKTEAYMYAFIFRFLDMKMNLK
jgi:protease II